MARLPETGAAPTSPLRGEGDARRRVRGAKVTRAKALRSNATDAEGRLWLHLRNRLLGGHKFARQVPVGPYVADFICREKGLVVEIDGSQHAGSDADARRAARLNAQGYSVVRFWNDEVLENTDGVLLALLATLNGDPSPDLRFAPATLSPTGRGTRGARAASAAVAARSKQQPQSVPLPDGERLGEGS
ncbi:endonuclease domain-containing protein [Paradevosia shaoguanensis]|uniref:endonuclease domain-containing protein n=1 Tax=Paradevosia shaoguanensis TaxID=1335043 RepID=UPI001934AB71|nr:endonuclease domain-containing protein [Paradevosia shaoguanensis]